MMTFLCGNTGIFAYRLDKVGGPGMLSYLLYCTGLLFPPLLQWFQNFKMHTTTNNANQNFDCQRQQEHLPSLLATRV